MSTCCISAQTFDTQLSCWWFETQWCSCYTTLMFELVRLTIGQSLNKRMTLIGLVRDRVVAKWRKNISSSLYNLAYRYAAQWVNEYVASIWSYVICLLILIFCSILSHNRARCVQNTCEFLPSFDANVSTIYLAIRINIQSWKKK